MPDQDYVNAVELSPLVPDECRIRVARDLHEARSNTALVIGLGALLDAAIGAPLTREYADQVLRQLAAPLADKPSTVNWRLGHG